jgi:hypothetical protein
MKHEAWYWLFHTAETCCSLDFTQCCVWMDCPIHMCCINTMGMTHINTGSQFYIFLYRTLNSLPYIITMLQAGWPKNSGLVPSKCTIFGLVHYVETGSGKLSTPYSLGTGISFLKCKTQSVCETDNFPPYHVKVKKVWSFPFNPHMPPRCIRG